MRRRPISVGGLPRPSFVAAAKKLLAAPLRETRVTGTSASQPSTAVRKERADGGNSTASDGAPDAARASSNASLEFRSEMAALLAFYATRIAAARRSLSPSAAAAIVQALLNEQAIALRALTDRQHAATQRQRDERPERPSQGAQRKSNDSKPT
jgi:hypothetical protein